MTILEYFATPFFSSSLTSPIIPLAKPALVAATIAPAWNKFIILPSAKWDQKMEDWEGGDSMVEEGKVVRRVWIMGPDSERTVELSSRMGAWGRGGGGVGAGVSASGGGEGEGRGEGGGGGPGARGRRTGGEEVESEERDRPCRMETLL